MATPTAETMTEALAPWRSPLSRALHRNRAQPFARYLQLATVRPDGTPANRTIVFRGFLANTNRLMFICDRRSEKTQHTHQNPAAEACWYFTKTREQFRLSGHLTLITAEPNGTQTGSTQTGSTQTGNLETHENTDSKTAQMQPCKGALLKAGQQARHTVWQNISANARMQFVWPHPKAPRSEAPAFSPTAPDEQTPPPTFCLLLLTVRHVDHLALRGEPQNRTLYEPMGEGTTAPQPEEDWRIEENWRIASVNP